MSSPTKDSLFIVYIITICLGWSVSLAKEKLKSNSGILESVLPNNDTEIIISGADFDSYDQDFIEALQKNRTPSRGDARTMNAAKFLSSLQLKEYRRTHGQNRFPTKYHSRDIHSHKHNKSKFVHTKVKSNSSQEEEILKLNQNAHLNFSRNKQKEKKTGFDEKFPQNVDPDYRTNTQKKETLGLGEKSNQNVDPDFRRNKQKKEIGFGETFHQNVDPDVNANKQKKETGRSQQDASNNKLLSDIENHLEIVDSWFQHLQPGDVVLLFHLIIMNTGGKTLNILTTHHCCFTMPKLEQKGEGYGKRQEEEKKAENCHSMALVGQREYTLVPKETRNVTLLFASTQLLIYQYQRKGYCEIEFISEGVGGSILASSTIYFDTAMGRVHEKEKKTKKNPNKHLSTTHLEIKDGLYTGRLCEDRNCIPVDCIQEFGGGANRFSIYRGKCMSTPYCAPNGLLFYDNRWNVCRNITDLRLDPILDLDEVPEMVKRGKSPLATGIEKLLPSKDLRTLHHMQCNQLKSVAERTWGNTFLCQNLPVVCERCPIK